MEGSVKQTNKNEEGKPVSKEHYALASSIVMENLYKISVIDISPTDRDSER